MRCRRHHRHRNHQCCIGRRSCRRRCSRRRWSAGSAAATGARHRVRPGLTPEFPRSPACQGTAASVHESCHPGSAWRVRPMRAGHYSGRPAGLCPSRGSTTCAVRQTEAKPRDARCVGVSNRTLLAVCAGAVLAAVVLLDADSPVQRAALVQTAASQRSELQPAAAHGRLARGQRHGSVCGELSWHARLLFLRRHAGRRLSQRGAAGMPAHGEVGGPRPRTQPVRRLRLCRPRVQLLQQQQGPEGPAVHPA